MYTRPHKIIHLTYTHTRAHTHTHTHMYVHTGSTCTELAFLDISKTRPGTHGTQDWLSFSLSLCLCLSVSVSHSLTHSHTHTHTHTHTNTHTHTRDLALTPQVPRRCEPSVPAGLQHAKRAVGGGGFLCVVQARSSSPARRISEPAGAPCLPESASARELFRALSCVLLSCVISTALAFCIISLILEYCRDRYPSQILPCWPLFFCSRPLS